MTESEQTYTILKTKLQESLDEQIDLQTIDINDVLKQSLVIRELSDVLNDTVDDEFSIFSNS
ncbi:MAG: hypothetical protein ACW9W3_01025 [Candidatus Nitrosopumilus sp. bin_68KS]